MTIYTKRQKNRSRIVRQWLMAEMRLAAAYKAGQPPAQPKAKEWQSRVIEATERTRTYMRNFDDAHMRFFDMMLAGNMNRAAICDAIGIHDNTYDNWRNAMIQAFGSAMGIWI